LSEGEKIEGVHGLAGDGGGRNRRMRCGELLRGEQPQIAREVEHQHGDQHQHRAEERVQEELDRRVLPPRAAPDADQEVHRQEHHLPEHVEQEEVERHEHAEHAGDEQQEEHVVGLDVLRDRPAGGTGEHREERGEHHERHADAVHTEQVLDVEGRNPRLLHHRLHARLAHGELGRANRPEECRPRHPQREHEYDHRGGERDPANRLLASFRDDRQRKHRGNEGRQEDDRRQGPEGGLREGGGGGHRGIR